MRTRAANIKMHNEDAGIREEPPCSSLLRLNAELSSLTGEQLD